MKKIIYSILVFAFVFLSTGVIAQAADFRVGAKSNGSVNIGADEDITNLYTAGNIITIDANIKKGVHAAGNVVNINGTVGSSVYSAGGTLLIGGDVAGSVHGAGGSVIIESNVADDVIVAGGNMMISKGTTIGGDLVVGAGTLDFQGSVTGNVYLGGGVVTLNGLVGGDVKIEEVEDLTIGKDSIINGNLEYYSKNEIVIEEGAVINGEIIKTEGKFAKKDIDKGMLAGILFTIISIALFIKVIGLIIVGLIAVYLFRRFTKGMVTEALSNFWQALGVGLAVLILMPIVAVILMVTVVGLWLGILILMAYGLTLFTAGVLASVTFGSWMVHMIRKGNAYQLDWKVVAAGVIVLGIVVLIPFIGWLFGLIFMLINLGAIYRMLLSSRK